MNSPIDPAPVCGDPMRRLVFDRIGRYFESPKAEKERVEGDCAICGQHLPDGVPDNRGGDPQCRAQRSITQSRTCPADGEPFAPGAKPKHIIGKKGKKAGEDKLSEKNSLNQIGCTMLIAPDRTFLAANVMPSLPLPREMTVMRVVPGVQGQFLREFVANPPPTPFLLVLWARKAGIKLVMTESLARIAICGDDVPRHADLRVVRRHLALIDKMGLAPFKDACLLRAQINGLATAANKKKILERLEAFRSEHVMPAAEFNTLPSKESAEYDLAVKAAGQEPEAGGEDAELAA